MSDARKYPGFSLISIATYEQLLHMTSGGWVVLDVLEDGKVQSQLTTLPIKCVGQIHDPNNYSVTHEQSYVERVTVDLPCALTHHLFVMGLDETATHAYLEQERAEARKALAEKTAEHKVVTAANEQLLKDVRDLQDKLRSAEARYRDANDDRNEQRNLRHRLEEDLGKLRTAVGELQFLNLTWRCNCDHGRPQHDTKGCTANGCHCKRQP